MRVYKVRMFFYGPYIRMVNVPEASGKFMNTPKPSSHK